MFTPKNISGFSYYETFIKRDMSKIGDYRSKISRSFEMSDSGTIEYSSVDDIEKRFNLLENFLFERSQFNQQKLLLSIGSLVSKLTANDFIYRNEIFKLTSTVQILENELKILLNKTNFTEQISTTQNVSLSIPQTTSAEKPENLKESKTETDSAINVKIIPETSTPKIHPSTLNLMNEIKKAIKLNERKSKTETDSFKTPEKPPAFPKNRSFSPHSLFEFSTPSLMSEFESLQIQIKNKSKPETDSANNAVLISCQSKNTKAQNARSKSVKAKYEFSATKSVHEEIFGQSDTTKQHIFKKLPLLHGDPLPPLFQKLNKKRKHKSLKIRQNANSTVKIIKIIEQEKFVKETIKINDNRKHNLFRKETLTQKFQKMDSYKPRNEEPNYTHLNTAHEQNKQMDDGSNNSNEIPSPNYLGTSWRLPDHLGVNKDLEYQEMLYQPVPDTRRVKTTMPIVQYKSRMNADRESTAIG